VQAGFPVVKNLSDVKATQEDEDDDGPSKILAPKNPEPEMMDAASKSDLSIKVQIPLVNLDLNKGEYDALLQLANDFLEKQKKKSKQTTQSEKKQNAMVFALTVQRIVGVAHDESRSIVLVGDGFKGYVLMNDGEMLHTRALLYEATLYEATNISKVVLQTTLEQDTIAKRCSRLRARFGRTESTIANPILYRSKLGFPLSPETPSFCLDFLSLDDDDEKALYLTIYNTTHRYSIDRSWMDTVISFFSSDKQQQDDTESLSSSSSSSLVRAFISFADCTIDYKSPSRYNTASRLLLRVGEFRITSNLLIPLCSLQSFRISLGDLSLHLANKRHSYNYENMRLSLAARILHPEDQVVDGKVSAKWHTQALENVLQSMNFVTVVMLDSMTATVMVSNDDKKKTRSTERPPKVAIAASFGCLNSYCCKDSFACLISTINEVQMEMVSLSDEQIEELRGKRIGYQPAISEDENDAEMDDSQPVWALEVPDNELSASELRKKHQMRKERTPLSMKPYYTVQTGETETHEAKESFAEDNDWTTIDHEWSREETIPQGQEQSSTWLGEGISIQDGGLRVFPQHVPVYHIKNPFEVGNMNADRYAGTKESPLVGLRIIIGDLGVNCRFFDGYDWIPDAKLMAIQHKSTQEVKEQQIAVSRKRAGTEEDEHNAFLRKKNDLMGDLLGGQDSLEPATTFQNVPLPEERVVSMRLKAEERRLARRTNRFFQFSASGVKVRLDAFPETSQHRLASCLDLTLNDMFLSETLSSSNPIKMLGEWVNEVEHPRDSSDGLVMFKLVTWRPEIRVTSDGTIMGDDTRSLLSLLPLRFFLDQGTIRFIKNFFEKEEDEEYSTPVDDIARFAEPFCKSFKVKPCKLKVNYVPDKVDVDALRDGSLVELVNICPLEDMVLQLQPVAIRQTSGWGSVIGQLTKLWIEDIVSTQLYKFVANAVPFQPLTSVGGGAAEMVVLPWEAFKEEGDVIGAVRTGTFTFVETLAYETLNLTSKLTKFAASKVATTLQGAGLPSAPSRPDRVPRRLTDTARHSLESVSRGLKTANYKIVIVPFREYRKGGPTEAAKSVMKGIPVAIMAPLGGASEAISYTLLGVRNQVRPEIRKEDEAAQRGLHHNLQ